MIFVAYMSNYFEMYTYTALMFVITPQLRKLF